MTRTPAILAALVTLALTLPTPGLAQTRALAQGPEQPRVIVLPSGLDEQRAEDIRQAFREVMKRYPPALGRVLKLDPSLMANQAYLAPYPALVEFMKIHPEVGRYPDYFLNYVGDSGGYEPQDSETRMREQAFNMWRNMMESLTIFAVFITVVLAILSLVRYVIGHRRWIRATKVQSEVHSRLLERFSSNDELLAYVQSPAGSHFLKAAPISAADVAGPTMSAPFSRILWSVQAGLVLACAGVGLLFIKRYVMEEVAEMMLTLGVLGVSLGIGFVLAAFVSYMLSDRLGLFEGLSRKSESSGA